MRCDIVHDGAGPLLLLRGAGEMATGVAVSLYRAGYRHLVLLETPTPLAVRRGVAFAEAVHLDKYTVEGCTAVRSKNLADLPQILTSGDIPLIVDQTGETIATMNQAVVVDAIMAKYNTGTSKIDAPLVIGLGPGFHAGKDVHVVIETQRGPNLGRVIEQGPAAANTRIPDAVNGYTLERILRSPISGLFRTDRDIGEHVAAGEMIGRIEPDTERTKKLLEAVPIYAAITGVLRGLLRNAMKVTRGMKLGDVDPRADPALCYQISDKALAVGAGVVSAVQEHFHCS